MPAPLIIIGASARAAAQSAIRAGYAPWCIDLFADRDLRAIAEVRKCPRDKWPHGVLDLLNDAPADAPVLFTGAMENHLGVVAQVAAQRPLLGGSPRAMAHVRDPMWLVAAAEHVGLGWCIIRERLPWHAFVSLPRWCRQRGVQFLIKPRRGAHGRGVRFWSRWRRVRRDEHLQEFICGRPLSAVFCGGDQRAAFIGMTEQIIGDAAFGASGFRYVGNIGPIRLPIEITARLWWLASIASRDLLRRGPFGIDLVLAHPTPRRAVHSGQCYPVELNPRYPASAEVIERACRCSALTAAYKRHGGLRNAERTWTTAALAGKAIVFAQAACRAPDLYDFFDRDAIADVPGMDAYFEPGDPICTVFANGADRDDVLTRLRERAAAVYACLRPL